MDDWGVVIILNMIAAFAAGVSVTCAVFAIVL